MEKTPVIAVVGPTASGKTSLAVEIAKRYNGEVVSADSMQIYKGMDIATAKPTAEEMQGIRHHLIDFVSPYEKYSVARYIEDATKAVEEIRSRAKLPVLCGGTGLYAESFLNNIRFEEEPDNEQMRTQLTARLENEGAAKLLEELRKIDPEAAAGLHQNNAGRIIRALEVYYLTGETATQRRLRSVAEPSRYDVFWIALSFPDREYLYDRINQRVDIMLENGLEEEARDFLKNKQADTAAQAIGYKELSGWFDGRICREEAIENLKRETRRYAKRQITWFKRNNNIHYIERNPSDSTQQIAEKAFDLIEKSGFLKGV